MKIGILQSGHAPEALIGQTGDYDAIFARLLDGYGFTFQTWNVVDMQFPDNPSDADGWLITGSRHGAYEGLPFIAPLETFVRDIYSAKRPLIGVCFGHQLIAQALGGKVEKFDGGWSVGRTEYTRTNGQTVAINAWHQDQVTKRPADAVLTASSSFCENAMLTYGNSIWTVQAHPEMSNEFVDGLARTRGKGVVPDHILQEAQAKLDQPTDRLDVGADMAAFFKHAAHEAAA